MINKEIFWAKARCSWLLTNPGINSGVIELPDQVF
jgi:hypothetical protein